MNGTQVSSVAGSGGIASSNGPLTIGGDPIYPQYFSGRIDEVRVYNRARTAAEIQADMLLPIASGASALIAPSAAGSPATRASQMTLRTPLGRRRET